MIAKNTKFILAILFQIAVIFLVILSKYTILNTGVEVRLRILPVDPRTPLRGDYMKLSYNISNLNSRLADGHKIRNGDTVYVVLDKQGRYWEAKNISKTKPTGSSLFIKGTVIRGGVAYDTIYPDANKGLSNNLLISYGIEDYFIPESSGRDLNIRNKEMSAAVVIDRATGEAVLKQVFLDNEPWP